MRIIQVFVVLGIISFTTLVSSEGCPRGKFGWQCRYDCFCGGPCDNVTGHCENCTGTRWGPGCLLNSSCTYHDDKGKQYQGRLSVDALGRTCIPWHPQIYNYGPDRFPDGDLKKASNYCRNPRADGNVYGSKPWCYYQRNPFKWGYSSIVSCSCPQGRFGLNCLSECHCTDQENTCDSASGVCQRDVCHEHFQGNNCQECVDRRFSIHCDRICRCQEQTEVCNKTTGHCASGCAAGWTGDGCQSACMDGTFGRNCIARCRCHDTTDVCEKTNGTCTNSGCAAGWHGPGCQTACMDGTFGSNCVARCKCLNTTEVCEKANGTCPNSGCAAGWQGTGCQTGCEAGRYGADCKYICSSGCGNTCNRVDGRCSCKAGYKSSTCAQRCLDGTFGHNCTYMCNCLNRTEVCEKATGNCGKTGCRPGWHGQGCQIAYTSEPGQSVAWGVAGLFAALFVVSVLAQVIVLWRCLKQKSEHKNVGGSDAPQTNEIYYNIKDIQPAENDEKYETMGPTSRCERGKEAYEQLRFDQQPGDRKKMSVHQRAE